MPGWRQISCGAHTELTQRQSRSGAGSRSKRLVCFMRYSCLQWHLHSLLAHHFRSRHAALMEPVAGFVGGTSRPDVHVEQHSSDHAGRLTARSVTATEAQRRARVLRKRKARLATVAIERSKRVAEISELRMCMNRLDTARCAILDAIAVLDVRAIARCCAGAFLMCPDLLEFAGICWCVYRLTVLSSATIWIPRCKKLLRLTWRQPSVPLCCLT